MSTPKASRTCLLAQVFLVLSGSWFYWTADTVHDLPQILSVGYLGVIALTLLQLFKPWRILTTVKVPLIMFLALLPSFVPFFQLEGREPEQVATLTAMPFFWLIIFMTLPVLGLEAAYYWHTRTRLEENTEPTTSSKVLYLVLLLQGVVALGGTWFLWSFRSGLGLGPVFTVGYLGVIALIVLQWRKAWQILSTVKVALIAFLALLPFSIPLSVVAGLRMTDGQEGIIFLFSLILVTLPLLVLEAVYYLMNHFRLKKAAAPPAPEPTPQPSM